MNYFWQLLGGLTGAAIGSFLGVLIERKNRQVPNFAIVGGRSRCRICRHQLSWRENIPLFSYILLRGKCGKCRSPIPYWLPLIELAGAVAGAAIATQIGQISPISLIGLILIALALVWIFFADLVSGVVPDWAVIIGSAGALIFNFSRGAGSRPAGQFSIFNLPSAFLAAAFFWFLVKITRGRGMGVGDVTLAFFLGLWLGWPLILLAVWLAFILGAAVGLSLIALKRKTLKQTIPFGPFLITGALVATRWGRLLLDMVF